MQRIDAVGKVRIERHRHSNIAEDGHLWRGYQAGDVHDSAILLLNGLDH
jgi:hypothetical protein